MRQPRTQAFSKSQDMKFTLCFGHNKFFKTKKSGRFYKTLTEVLEFCKPCRSVHSFSALFALYDILAISTCLQLTHINCNIMGQPHTQAFSKFQDMKFAWCFGHNKQPPLNLRGEYNANVLQTTHYFHA